jgi:hypothetical protein
MVQAPAANLQTTRADIPLSQERQSDLAFDKIRLVKRKTL